MEEKKVQTLFEEVRDDISKYISCTIGLAKLEAFEKISKASASIMYIGLILGVGILALLLIFLTLALYLGELLGKMWLGFALVAGVAILILLIIAMFRKPIKRSVTNRAVHFLIKKDDTDTKSENKKQ